MKGAVFSERKLDVLTAIVFTLQARGRKKFLCTCVVRIARNIAANREKQYGHLQAAANPLTTYSRFESSKGGRAFKPDDD